jgi:hypothetical protein
MTNKNTTENKYGMRALDMFHQILKARLNTVLYWYQTDGGYIPEFLFAMDAFIALSQD